MHSIRAAKQHANELVETLFRCSNPDTADPAEHAIVCLLLADVHSTVLHDKQETTIALLNAATAMKRMRFLVLLVAGEYPHQPRV